MPTERRSPRSSALGLLFLVPAVLSAACVAAPGTPGGGAAPTPASQDGGPVAGDSSSGVDVAGLSAAASTATIRAAIAAADLSEPTTIDAVGAIRFADGADTAAAAAIKAGASGDALWAATWVYATAGTEPKVLRPVLKATDPSTRALAASAVLSWGDASGAAVLADLLLDEEMLSGAEPPEAVADYAAGSLARYIVGPGIADEASREDVAGAWSSWIAAHGTAMRFSTKTGLWTAP